MYITTRPSTRLPTCGKVIRHEPIQLLEDGTIEVLAVNDDVTDVEEDGKALGVLASIRGRRPLEKELRITEKGNQWEPRGIRRDTSPAT